MTFMGDTTPWLLVDGVVAVVWLVALVLLHHRMKS